MRLRQPRNTAAPGGLVGWMPLARCQRTVREVSYLDFFNPPSDCGMIMHGLTGRRGVNREFAKSERDFYLVMRLGANRIAITEQPQLPCEERA